MSDFNTEDSRREPSAVSSAVGLYGLGETNEGGDQLEDFCLEYELALANTMFKQHPRQCIPVPLLMVTPCASESR